jgi:hypothetical protein
MPPERYPSGIDVHVIPRGDGQLLRRAGDTFLRPAVPAGTAPYPTEVTA